MFRQKMYDILLDWKSRFQSRTAMLVEGARCVGKSTVVEEFARREYRSYILVDFAEASRDVHELFDDVSDLDYLFLQLQLRYSARLFDRESLIIFDEVQMCLRVRRAIKQLVKDGRYDYIGTGSLVSIRRNTRDILIPSEEERAQMRPMDFEEFLWARGDDATVPLLRRAFASRRPLGERLNRRLMRDFRFYMLVGGMPQAVDALLRTNDLRAVDDVKRVIIDLYEEDMHKISPSGVLSMLFDAIPAQLAKKSSRYHVSSVLAGRRPVRDPRLQGRGLHRQHRVREAPVGQAAREPRHGLRERRRLGAHRPRKVPVLPHLAQAGNDPQLRDRLHRPRRQEGQSRRGQVIELQDARLTGRILRKVLLTRRQTVPRLHQGPGQGRRRRLHPTYMSAFL